MVEDATVVESVEDATVVDSVEDTVVTSVVVFDDGTAVVVFIGATVVVLTPVLLVTGFVVEVVAGADSVLQPTRTAAKAAEMQTVLII